MSQKIPTHNFAFDDSTSIPFRFEALEHKNNYDVDVPHRHNYYEIFFFKKGGGEHIIDFDSHPINDHSVHFISPGQVHQVNRNIGSNGFVIMFSRDFTHGGSDNKDLLYELPFFHNFTKNPTIDCEEKDFFNIDSIFQNIELEYQEHQLFNSEILQSFLNILLLKCKRIYKSTPLIASNDQLDAQKFIRLIETNYQETNQVQEYAKMMGISPNQLNEITKKSIGKTASEMIQERILLEAKRLLIHSSMTAKEIAYLLNFGDPAYFSRFFKNHVGVPPNDFKKLGLEKYKT